MTAIKQGDTVEVISYGKPIRGNGDNDRPLYQEADSDAPPR
jgi:hypothetical protein